MSGPVCGVCERGLRHGDTGCAGCARDTERARARAELEDYRRRLQPQVLTNSRNHAYWALAAALESLAVAYEVAPEDQQGSIRRAREYAHAARLELTSRTERQ